ncbi:MAG: hypothetical protein IJH77_06370 [Mogibacterium sp.]|nr:hypothetical protein [Mogibacterium sp.]
MQHAFIINPASGNGKKAAKLKEALEALASSEDRIIRWYLTGGEKDASVLASKLAEEAAAKGEEIRIYACGGDGTIHEVVNGLVGHPNAMLGVIPAGSGNDFVRCFETPESFTDLRKQLDAEAIPIDVLRCSYEQDGKVVEDYCINGINIGFDGNTAILAHNLKELPGVNGTFSYLLALVINRVKTKVENLTVVADGTEVYRGPLILCTAANGRFCGGGFESCPNALLDNGKIELLVVKDITRRDFVRMAPKYKAGKLFEIKGVEKIAVSLQPKQVVITPARGTMRFVADGEILETGTLTVEVLPGAVRLLQPK